MQESYPSQEARQRFVPQSLKNLRRWCRWTRQTKPGTTRSTKVPDQSTLDLTACRTWDRIADLPITSDEGPGLVMTGTPKIEHRRLIAIDLDACFDGRVVSSWALEIVTGMASYTEISPSGRGLRIFVRLDSEWPKDARLKSKVAAPAPVGVDKAPEVQVFGSGPAGYVTITGNPLPGYEIPVAIASADGMAALLRHLGTKDEAGAVDLPPGTGPRPQLDELTGAVVATHHGLALVEGRWKDTGAKSASEAYFVLATKAYAEARGHADVVVDWLLGNTAWGAGRIDDSADPGKYTRRSWVERDVARIATRSAAATAAAAFHALTEEEEVGVQNPPVHPPTLSTPSTLLTGHADFVGAANKQAWLVKGLVPRTGIVQFFGDPGSGKTPCAMSLAMHVAAGRPTWWGHKIARTGKVVYLIGEDAQGLRWRALAEQKRLGISTEELEGKVFWSTMPGQLTDAEDAKKWLAAIREAVGDDIALLVVDTQSRNFGAGDENSTQDMAQFVHHLAEFARVLGCCVLPVHHTGHSNKDRGRGSMVMLGALDGCYRVTNEEGRVKVVGVKCKNWATPEPLVGALDVQVLGHDEDGDPITSVALDTDPPPVEEVEIEATIPDDLAEVLRAVESGADGLEEIADLAGVSKTSCHRKLAELVATGMVEKTTTKSANGRNVASFGITEEGRKALLLS
jgi:hypothetical protein